MKYSILPSSVGTIAHSSIAIDPPPARLRACTLTSPTIPPCPVEIDPQGGSNFGAPSAKGGIFPITPPPVAKLDMEPSGPYDLFHTSFIIKNRIRESLPAMNQEALVMDSPFLLRRPSSWNPCARSAGGKPSFTSSPGKNCSAPADYRPGAFLFTKGRAARSRHPAPRTLHREETP